jgi:hypothetical protein
VDLVDYTQIPKDTVFDPPEDIEETEVLRYNLTDITSKESGPNYRHYSISNCKSFNFDRTIHNNLTHLSDFLEELAQNGNRRTTAAQQFAL